MKKFLTLLTLLIFGVSWSFAEADFTYEYDSANQSLTLTSAEKVSGDVVIPEFAEYNGNYYSVTSIGDKAFFRRSGLTSVTIGNSVTSIGDSAFEDCSGLTSVTIGNYVTSIGNSAFEYCDAMTSVTIPDSVISIGDYAFCYCEGLNSVTIGNSVTSIGKGAFSSCSALTTIEVNSGNPMYASSEGVLFNKDLSTLIQFPRGKCGNYVIPESVTSIGIQAFYNCSGLTSVTIGNSVTSIGNYAFQNCYDLNWVTIGNSVTSIGDRAFEYCRALTSMKIPDSVISIGESAFFYCDAMTSVTIGNSVTSIGESAFDNCFRLTSVIIGNSVTSIGDWAFAYCRSLKNISCLAQNPPVCLPRAFSNSNSEAILYVPANSLDDYINASNDDNSGWSFFGNRIYPIVQAEQLIINPTELAAYAGDTFTIKATVLPENAHVKRLAWESTDENVAVVSQEGVVSILHDGECEIIVRTVDGSDLSAVCKIKVMSSGIEGIDADENAVYEVYSLNGVLIDPSADAEAIRALAPGIYILRNEKGITKLIK